MKLLRPTFIAAFTLAVSMLLGCGRDTDDLYQSEFPDVGAFLHQEACVACLEDQCATEWTACMDDAACLAEYECRAQCKDPLCHQKCRRDLVSAWDDAQLWVDQEPARLATLGLCAAQRCVDECAVGRDFRCTGQYTLPVDAEAGSQELVMATLEFPTHEPVPGMRAAVCSQGDPMCDVPTSTYDASQAPFVMTLRGEPGGFRQHFRFEQQGAEPDQDPIAVNFDWQTLPWSKGQFSAHYVFRRSLARANWEGLGLTFDPERPGVTIVAFDCAGMQAVGLRMEVEADCAPFDRCDFYWSGAFLSPDLRETQGGSTASITTPLPANQVHTVRLVDVETGALVTQFSPNLPPATQHTWWAYPLTDAQQEELP